LNQEDKKLVLFLELFEKRFKNISVYELWVMKQLICQFGMDSVSLPLEKLAKHIGVQHKKLREVLAELEEGGLIEVSFPEQRERARVRQIKLVIQSLNANFNDLNSMDEQLQSLIKKCSVFPFTQIY
jgi:DNA-binding MarR family transcriptional regulator